LRPGVGEISNWPERYSTPHAVNKGKWKGRS
jgi:hypothetical protein